MKNIQGKQLKTIYINAKVYTVDGAGWDTNPQEAFAVDEDGRIAFVGANDAARRLAPVGANDAARNLAGERTSVVDLQGRTVLPGFVDGHAHAPGLSLIQLHNINLYGIRTKHETLACVADFIHRNPDLDVYFGMGFLQGVTNDPRGPRKEWLDEIEREKPVILNSHDGHTYWMNTKALEIQGIRLDTKAPTGGGIKTDDETGALWGTVTDCMNLITLKPEYTEAEARSYSERRAAAAARSYSERRGSQQVDSFYCSTD
jgi:predicted amidohydrolase YtcJ